MPDNWLIYISASIVTSDQLKNFEKIFISYNGERCPKLAVGDLWSLNLFRKLQ